MRYNRYVLITTCYVWLFCRWGAMKWCVCVQHVREGDNRCFVVANVDSISATLIFGLYQSSQVSLIECDTHSHTFSISCAKKWLEPLYFNIINNNRDIPIMVSLYPFYLEWDLNLQISVPQATRLSIHCRGTVLKHNFNKNTVSYYVPLVLAWQNTVNKNRCGRLLLL